MFNRSDADRIVWITQHTGLNRRNITSVFHGKNGHIEVHLTGGESRAFTETDLTSEGRELLCPPVIAPGHLHVDGNEVGAA